MSVFGNYARYYDLLYRDKDYSGESQFIHNLVQTHAPNTATILELGCGTGNHAQLLAKAGYQVHGVDLSSEMLERANQRCSQIPQELAANLQFTQGDIRQVRLDQEFDAVLSLFHVMSYQTTNADLLAAFQTVKAHLKPGGIFIFDVWYGPAVLSDRPTVRVKRLENEAIQVTRIAEPVMYSNENLVDVNYHVFIRDKQTSNIEELKETHRMRYLFKPELEALLIQAGLSVLDCREWMSNKALSFDSWYACWIMQTPNC
jgi:SAM-dependent methyltransferase